MHSEARWRLQGPVIHLLGRDGRSQDLDRRSAALLIILAVEGEASRARLANLLYPDTPERAARNNLVQLLRRLSRSVGEALVVGTGHLRLSADVWVDPCAPTWLSGPTSTDLPEVAAWALSRAERLSGAQRDHHRRLADEAEAVGQLQAAAAAWAEYLRLEPLDEHAWCRQIRLLYTAGDVPGALAAFEACRTALKVHLDQEPDAETLRIAQAVRDGSPPVPPEAARVRAPLLAPLHSPELIGRVAEWQAMEQAWARGQNILVSGPAGVGKTRLAQAFASSRGAYAHQLARPGDAALPYGAAARNLRRILSTYPKLHLDGWVRHELSRILPELQDDSPPAPMQGPSDRDRFVQAVASVLQHEAQQVNCTLDDDTHYYDRASFDLGRLIFEQAAAAGGHGKRPHLIFTFRTGEAPEALLDITRASVAQGLAVHIELGPLSASDVQALVNTVNVGAKPDVSALTLVTGGHPLYVLEALRFMDQAGAAPGTADPLPPTLMDTIRAGLQHLPTFTLQVARAAATLQSDFDPELIASVLGAPLLDVSNAWRELEERGVLRAGDFTHDLTAEAVRTDIPGAVRSMLHRCAARALEQRGGDCARIALHWQRGGELAQAAPWLQQVAAQAAAAGRPSEAAAWYASAAEAYHASGDPAAVAAVRRARAQLPSAPG